MIKRGRGQIVSVSSMLENSDFTSYSITKYAMTGFMSSLANYLKDRKLNGIRTMNVSAGIVNAQSEMIMDEQQKK